MDPDTQMEGGEHVAVSLEHIRAQVLAKPQQGIFVPSIPCGRLGAQVLRFVEVCACFADSARHEFDFQTESPACRPVDEACVAHVKSPA
jgi:hypothetical protein